MIVFVMSVTIVFTHMINIHAKLLLASTSLNPEVIKRFIFLYQLRWGRGWEVLKLNQRKNTIKIGTEKCTLLAQI